jgi:serine/threonine-protein kinase
MRAMRERDDEPPTIADTEGATSPDTGTRMISSAITRYRITGVIGRGGMGEVLSARDEQIGRSVAIKRLRAADPDPDTVARFLREVRIQGRLEHPAIVPVHELAYDDDGQPFFVMKQLQGTTLAELLPRLAARDPQGTAAFTPQRLLRAFAEACLAVELAHTRGVVHRDLKPANIMLGDFGEVYVLDWGVAKVAGEAAERGSFADIDTAPDAAHTVAGAILGTPGYISPEQIRNDPDLDGRADVYALGCILFEILTLQALHPRGGAGLASAIAGIDARASVRAPDRDIPPELDAICVRATAPEARDRFPTARALGDAVQRYLDGNRDVSARKQLARAELALARDALAGTTARDRRNAIRAAARAVALDPTDRDAVELVGHLMLEPPAQMPAEVTDELERADVTALRESAKFGILGAAALLLFFPVLYWIGFRELWCHVAGAAICFVIIVIDVAIAPRYPQLASQLANVAFLGLIGLLSWMISPVIVGPGPAVMMVTLTAAAHRRVIRPWLLAIFTWIAALSPWFLELAGVVGTRTTIADNAIVLHTEASSLAVSPTLIGLAFYVISVIHIATLLSRLQDDDRRAHRRALQLQSWQLRQLVPRASSMPA